MTQLVQSLVSGLALGALYAVIGMGFVVIYRVTRVLNLAEGVLAVLGAYVMSSLTSSLPWGLALVISGVVASVAAGLMGIMVITAKRVLEYSSIIMTLGIAFASQGVFILVWGAIPRSYPPVSKDALRLFGAYVLPQQLLLFGTVAVLLILLHVFFAKAYLGKALTAAALNPRAAQLAGVNLVRMGTVAFMASGFVVGLSGAIFGALVPVTPESHLALAVAGFAAAVFGNLYSPLGTVLGGLLLGQLTSAAATYGFPEYQQVVALIVLVVVLFGRTVWTRREGAVLS